MTTSPTTQVQKQPETTISSFGHVLDQYPIKEWLQDRFRLAMYVGELGLVTYENNDKRQVTNVVLSYFGGKATIADVPSEIVHQLRRGGLYLFIGVPIVSRGGEQKEPSVRFQEFLVAKMLQPPKSQPVLVS